MEKQYDEAVCEERHKNINSCNARNKIDIKNAEKDIVDIGNRLSAIEPQIKTNKEDIRSMRKLQVSTLIGVILLLLAVVGEHLLK